MVTSCYEMTLRSIIGRRSQVRPIAPKIIFSLLGTLKSLHDMNMVNQRIRPENIGLSGDGKELVHLEVSNMMEPKFKWCQEAFNYSAYTKRVASNEHGYNKTSFKQDRYSAGAVIMELLGGSDLVLQAEKPYKMEELLRLYRPYIHY